MKRSCFRTLLAGWIVALSTIGYSRYVGHPSNTLTMAGFFLLLVSAVIILYAIQNFRATLGIAWNGSDRHLKDNRKRRRFEDYLLDDTVSPGGCDLAVPLSAKAAAKNLEKEVFQFSKKGGIPILVLFGTEYGFSREVAGRLARELAAVTEVQLSPRVLNMLHFQLLDLNRERLVLVVCSTTGDGVVPNDARPFADQLESGALQLRHDLRYSVLALGDRGYPHFCRAGRHFDDLFLVQSGNHAVQIAERFEVDQDDWSTIEGWMNAVKSWIVENDMSVKQWTVDDDYLSSSIDSGGVMIADIANDTARKFTKDSPFLATVTNKRPLSVVQENGDKETIHIEIDLGDSGINYSPGDALGVVPSNNPDLVRETLAALHMSGHEQADSGVTVREFLERRADLKNLRAQPLMQLIKTGIMQSGNSSEKERWRGMGRNGDTLNAYLREREFTDVLTDFPSARLAPEQLPLVLKALQPRFYSISSSPAIHGPRTVSLTVSVVRYCTLGKNREGVATCFLADRTRVRDRVPVFLSRNPNFRLPKDALLPIIMIGPGTGVAPFRAFVAERRNAKGRTLLFFGSRHYSRDFLYREELEALARQGQIELYTAFSRDQGHKIYVQHRMMEMGADIGALIVNQRAHVYVCGDASRMAHDVDRTLRAILQKYATMSVAETDTFLASLERERRYQRDVWVE